MGYFKDVTPESVGIESKGILDFIHDVKKHGIEQHSLMESGMANAVPRAGGNRMGRSTCIRFTHSANL